MKISEIEQGNEPLSQIFLDLLLGFFCSDTGYLRAWINPAICKACVQRVGIPLLGFAWVGETFLPLHLNVPFPFAAYPRLPPPTHFRKALWADEGDLEWEESIQSFWKAIPLKPSAVSIARAEVYTECSDLNKETNCGEAAFQHTGGAIPCGFYYQKAFKSAAKPLLTLSQWSKYHFSPCSCSLWVSIECCFSPSPPGRRCLLYKCKHLGNEIICVRIL